MSFTVANRVPITLIIEGKPYHLPRAKRKFWLEWAAEENARKLERATVDMSDEQRAQWMAIYQVAHTTTDDLIRLVTTPEGNDKIITHCMKAGGVPDELVEQVIENIGESQRAGLALALANIVEPQHLVSNNGNGKADGDEGGDPLARNVVAASTA